MPSTIETITLDLRYTTGQDDPKRHTYGNQALEPESSNQLLIEIHQLDEADAVFPGNPFQRQVHLVGTARALESLGTYLIALARLKTSEPEPHGHLDDIRFGGGGTISLIPRRVARLPSP
jgi:hypothetical protein